jgi:hypothetical protein
MKTEITDHAKERMKEYNTPEELVSETIRNPDSIEKSYGDRKIYQKKLNGYTLRVIVEENKGIKRIITVYKARSGRYGI